MVEAVPSRSLRDLRVQVELKSSPIDSLGQTGDEIMTTTHHAFPSTFQIELVGELAPMAQVYYFPPHRLQGADGLIVRVTPESNNPWVGIFANGERAARAKSGVYTSPDPQQLCAVARGAGYLVFARNPLNFEQIPASPIVEVLSITERDLIVFCDPWKAYGYDKNGLRWRTGRIAIDGFSIVDVTTSYIQGRGDTLDKEDAEFFVDLEDGAVRGVPF